MQIFELIFRLTSEKSQEYWWYFKIFLAVRRRISRIDACDGLNQRFPAFNTSHANIKGLTTLNFKAGFADAFSNLSSVVSSASAVPISAEAMCRLSNNLINQVPTDRPDHMIHIGSVQIRIGFLIFRRHPPENDNTGCVRKCRYKNRFYHSFARCPLFPARCGPRYKSSPGKYGVSF